MNHFIQKTGLSLALQSLRRHLIARALPAAAPSAASPPWSTTSRPSTSRSCATSIACPICAGCWPERSNRRTQVEQGNRRRGSAERRPTRDREADKGRLGRAASNPLLHCSIAPYFRLPSREPYGIFHVRSPVGGRVNFP